MISSATGVGTVPVNAAVNAWFPSRSKYDASEASGVLGNVVVNQEAVWSRRALRCHAVGLGVMESHDGVAMWDEVA